MQPTQQPEDDFTVLVAPGIELVIAMGGAQLTITWTKKGLSYQLVGQNAPGTTSDGSTAFTPKLTVGDNNESSSMFGPPTNQVFTGGRLLNAQHQWKEIHSWIKELLDLVTF